MQALSRPHEIRGENTKPLYKRILPAVVVITLISVFYAWFFHTFPRFNADEIADIRQTRLPAPPALTVISDRETIKRFTQILNACDFKPVIVFPETKGWDAKISITFKNSRRPYGIVVQTLDDCHLVNIGRRYYKTDRTPFDDLLDLASQKQTEDSGGALCAARGVKTALGA